MSGKITKRMTMTVLPLLLASPAALQAATLFQDGGYALQATELQFTFENANNNIWEAITTDASGNNRIAGAGGNLGNSWDNPAIAPDGTKSIIVVDNQAGWNFSNMATVPSDNYQVSIYASKNEQNWPYAHGTMTIADFDGVSLIVNSAGSFAAVINGTTIGSFDDVGKAGLMIQKKDGEFSFWRAPEATASWSQVGTTSSADVGNNFGLLHMFVKPGGGDTFWGYIDTFTVQSFIATDLTLGTGDTSGTYSDTIAGSSNVTKVGAGTWVINSNNTSTGTVTVEGGILDVNGSMANNGAANVFIHKDANDDFDNGQAPELQRAVGGLTSVAGFGATEVGGLGTVVTILAGSTNDATSIDMAFRGRNDAIVAGETSLLSSDVLQLEGLDGVVFVLQMSYSEAAALANGQAETTLRLGYLNTLTNQWEDAINGNHGTNTGSFFLSSYLDAGSPLDLGSYGVDVVNNVVWAVLDHNSYFAVVPTPGALPAGMLLMGLIALTKRRRQA
jgi:autotransporter-associated beta strand protein